MGMGVMVMQGDQKPLVQIDQEIVQQDLKEQQMQQDPKEQQMQ